MVKVLFSDSHGFVFDFPLNDQEDDLLVEFLRLKAKPVDFITCVKN